MFRDDKLYSLFKYWMNYKPEEELYVRLKENPVWPFKQIGDGYYYVSFRSDRVPYGSWIIVISILSFGVIVAVIGFFPLAFALFIILFGFGCWTLHGKLAWRELIISRRGKGKYMLRIFENEEIMFESEIRNVYIRLTRKIDALGDPYFCLVLSGFEMDDQRITRMTKAETPLRIMGMRIAYRVGINFFDWKDESEEHFIWHYKSYSKLKFKTHAEILYMNQTVGMSESVEGGYLAVPTAGQQYGSLKPDNVPRTIKNAPELISDEPEDERTKKKSVRINKVVKIRSME